MSSLSISIPDSICERVESLAREDGVSLDSYVASVLSPRVAVAEADSYIRRRGSRGSAPQMLNIPAQAPKIEPDQEDRLETVPN